MLCQPHDLMESKMGLVRQEHNLRNMDISDHLPFFFFLNNKHKYSSSINQRCLSHSHGSCSPLGSCNVTPLAKRIYLSLNDVVNFTIIPCFMMHRLYYEKRRETNKPSWMYNMAIKVVQIWRWQEILNIKAFWWFCFKHRTETRYTQSWQSPERTLGNKDYEQTKRE